GQGFESPQLHGICWPRATSKINSDPRGSHFGSHRRQVWFAATAATARGGIAGDLHGSAVSAGRRPTPPAHPQPLLGQAVSAKGSAGGDCAEPFRRAHLLLIPPTSGEAR